MTGPPHTPRSSGPRAAITPSFSFGFGFLPSFQFSPSRLISPQRFFQVGLAGSTLGRAIEPKEPLSNNNTGVFSESNELQVPANGTSSANDSLNDSLWSINSSQHVTGISSIYEEEPENKPYATPIKLIVTKSPEKQPGVTTGPNNPFDVSANSPDSESAAFEDGAATATQAPGRSQLEQLASAKRRRIQKTPYQGLDDSPDDQNGPGGHDQAERVWTSELDKVLYLAYLTYKEFKQTHGDSPGFKTTSQNNILSTMIFNKTGSRRTSKQIASRLHRLLRQTKPSFTQLPTVEIPQSVLTSSEEVSPLHTTSKQMHDDMSSLLVSSPLPETSIDEKYVLTPSDITIAYINRIDATKSIQFTKLLSVNDRTMDISQMRELLTPPVNELFKDSFLSKTSSKGISISHIQHCINISTHSLSPHSASSPLGSLSTDDGYFKANIKIRVEANRPPNSVLAWKCYTQIFKEDQSILKYNEDVNAYPLGEKYELPISFLKQFWSGYLTYMQNGGYDESSMNELSIVQVIYFGDGDFDPAKSTVCGILSHVFSIQLNSEGKSDVTTIKLADSKAKGSFSEEQLVMSAPPPLKVEPCQRPKFDGPVSAPIYNASIVTNLNQELIRKQEEFKRGDISPGRSMSIYSPFSGQPTPRHFSTSTPAKDLPGLYKQPMPQGHMIHRNMQPYPQPGLDNGMNREQAFQLYQHLPQQMHHYQAPPQQVNVMQNMIPMSQDPQQMPQEMQQNIMNQHRLMMQYQAQYPPVLKPTITVPNSAPASQTYFFQGSERQPVAAPPPTKPTASSSYHPPLSTTDTNKSKPMEITFVPILEYDPSKNIPKKQRIPSNSSVNKIGMGVHRYAQVSMYEPNKKK